jgi:hypothetical protein
MPDPKKREKDLGSGMLEDARKKINKRRDALADAAGTKKAGKPKHWDGFRKQ